MDALGEINLPAVAIVVVWKWQLHAWVIGQDRLNLTAYYLTLLIKFNGVGTDFIEVKFNFLVAFSIKELLDYV